MNSQMDLLESYAAAKGFENTLKTITFIKSESTHLSANAAEFDAYISHGVSIALMLKELNLPFTDTELDEMLAASVCHSLCEVTPDYDVYAATKAARISEGVTDLVKKMIKADTDDLTTLVPDNHMLFIIKLVERSDLIEHLCDMSVDEAVKFINDTKRYLLPMCIDGRDIFPEIENQINIIMEKMRTLIQVMDVLLKKYNTEQEELYSEILSLKEENSRMKKALKE